MQQSNEEWKLLTIPEILALQGKKGRWPDSPLGNTECVLKNVSEQSNYLHIDIEMEHERGDGSMELKIPKSELCVHSNGAEIKIEFSPKGLLKGSINIIL